jgi:DNA-binding NarL/FixJ family response regulator
MANVSGAVYESSQPQVSRSIRVVVVDDSQDFRVVICELLKMLFHVEVVGVGANGFEAIELTARTSPDLIIMDVNMPVLDGISAAGLIRHHFPTTTILMMSGDDSSDLKARCLEVGADAFTHKRQITRQIADLQPRLM